MRSLFLAAAMCFAIAACNNTTTTDTAADSQEQKNLEAARKVAQVFTTGDVGQLDAVVSPNFLDHTDMGDKRGIDSLKAMVQMIRANFKDMKVETIREVADTDYVYQWMRYSGTSDGTFFPKGPYDMQALEVSRFENGKAVEHWAFMEAQSVAKMMSQMNPGGMNQHNTGDTTKPQQH